MGVISLRRWSSGEFGRVSTLAGNEGERGQMLECSRARAGAARADRTLTKKAHNTTANDGSGCGCCNIHGLCQLGLHGYLSNGPIFARSFRGNCLDGQISSVGQAPRRSKRVCRLRY